MKLRKFTLVVIAALGIGFVDPRSATAAPPQTAPSQALGPEPIDVTIRVTGIAHLIGADGATERLLVIPNHKKSDHELLILVNNKIYSSELLGKMRAVRGDEYAYDEFPAGYELDLEASGWFRPAEPKLVFSEVGDEVGDARHADCPGGDIPDYSLHWLPRLSYVNRAPVKVKDTYVRKDPKTEHVLTRMEIVDGKLRTELQSSARTFEFDTNETTGAGDPDIVQAVADYLVYKFTAQVRRGQPFILKGRKFRNKTHDPEEWRELVRVLPDRGKVEIILANVVEEGFFNPEVTSEIEHFHHYYDVLYRPKMKILKVIGRDKCSTGSDSGVECGPVRP